MRTFGQTLKFLRDEKGLTQQDIANLFDKKWKTTVSSWEKDISFPGREILIGLADYFDVTVDYLIGRSDFRKGRLVTREELKEFLPQEVLSKHKLEIWVDEKDELEESTKEEIKELLRNHGYLK